MFELTVNGVVYQFLFGMGFMREINKTVVAKVDNGSNATKNMGLQYAVAGVVDGDLEALVDILDVANKGQNPRITRNALDSYIEDESTDIDKLFTDVLYFLGKANATKKTTALILEAVEAEKQKRAANP